MDWTYPATDSDSRAIGIAEIAERLVRDIGDSRLSGTRFTYDAREMLRATREIERVVENGGRLWVGFQRAEKLTHERARYARITAAGTEVTAFGTGSPEVGDDVRVRWTELPPSTDRIENQWFLVTTDPEPIAFVSWEVSDPERFGQGGISEPDKRFVGFVTDDRRVVDLLVEHLASVGPGR